jgi:hypothetical protein
MENKKLAFKQRTLVIMTTLTLSAALNSLNMVDLPDKTVPLTDIRQLYTSPVYVCDGVTSYLGIQYEREESMISYSPVFTDKDPVLKRPVIIIWCKELNGVNTIQFTKDYFMMLVKRGQVFADPQGKRVHKSNW